MDEHEKFCELMRSQGMPDDDPGEDFRLYREKAECGEPWAFRELGRCALLGIGSCANEEKAYRYFEEAARRGDPKAWRCLAWCAAEGIGGQASMSKAFRLLVKGAMAGDNEAERLIGMYYLRKNPPNCFSAKSWLKKAAEDENAEAKEIYHMYEPVAEFCR